MQRMFIEFQPDIIMHLAVESHVDRSIDAPDAFMQTNVVGTFTVLAVGRDYPPKNKSIFVFTIFLPMKSMATYMAQRSDLLKPRHVPSSPYSVSKAGSEHLVRAWGRTYGLPTVLNNCSNNYRLYHFPKKLIPLMILNALGSKPLPVYGDRQQIRDWLYVEDHARALCQVATQSEVGETYNDWGV